MRGLGASVPIRPWSALIPSQRSGKGRRIIHINLALNVVVSVHTRPWNALILSQRSGKGRSRYLSSTYFLALTVVASVLNSQRSA